MTRRVYQEIVTQSWRQIRKKASPDIDAGTMTAALNPDGPKALQLKREVVKAGIAQVMQIMKLMNLATQAQTLTEEAIPTRSSNY